MDEIMKYVSSVGFPIVVAWFSLTRLETAIKANTQCMTMIANKLNCTITPGGEVIENGKQ